MLEQTPRSSGFFTVFPWTAERHWQIKCIFSSGNRMDSCPEKSKLKKIRGTRKKNE